MVKAGSIYIGFWGVGPSPCSATVSVWGDLGQSLSSPASCSSLPSGRKDRGMTQRVRKCLAERMLHRHKGAREAPSGQGPQRSVPSPGPESSGRAPLDLGQALLPISGPLYKTMTIVFLWGLLPF